MAHQGRLLLDGLKDLGYWEDICSGEEKMPTERHLVFRDKLRATHFVAMSFCGVLTTTKVLLGEEGEKLFECNQRDLLGVQLLKKYGFRVMVISNRRTKVVERRCQKMDVEFFTADDVEKDGGKAAVLRHILYSNHIFESQVLYIGDDINDLEVMAMANLSIATRDAHRKVKFPCDYVTSARGGEQAVREVAELLLLANGYELKL